jgi:predicted RNA-binding Zn ribbon-like protein
MPDDAARLPLLGGALCLDFTNTLEPWGAEQPREFITTYLGLLAWAVHAGALAAEQAAALSALAETQPATASAVLDEARSLRCAIYRLFSSAAQGRPARQDDLERLNGVLTEAGCHRHLEQAGAGLAWGWQGMEADLRAALWPVALSAADVLASPQLARVKACAGCGWLFLDGSRPGTRRWCDMSVCGNRAKARRHYARTRKVTSP